MSRCRNKRNIDLKLKGYMTVEASFIMPWVIFLIVFLIYSSFYLYDKCVLFQDVYVLCFRGSVQKEDGGALNYINGHMSGQFGSKYFGVGRVDGSVEQAGNKVKVSGECAIKVPVDNFLTFSAESGWQIHTEAKAQIINPAKAIRKYRIGKNLIENAG